MKTLRASKGPFVERPFFSEEEIERVCERELRSLGLMPKAPSPVRIDRFIEKRFDVVPKYEDLEKGVLGFTVFGEDGVEEIIVSRHLSEDEDLVSQRRLSTTLAHEAGHGIFHSHLFALMESSQSLFEVSQKYGDKRILCRDDTVKPEASRRVYDGRWWEYQANRAMGALLIPRILVNPCLESLFLREGALESKVLPLSARPEATKRLSEVFEVNPVVARIKLADLFPVRNELQLSL